MNEMFPHENNQCSVCAKPTAYYCQRCREPYCSEYCQIGDWQQHKQFCTKMPALVSCLANNIKSASTSEESIKMQSPEGKQAPQTKEIQSLDIKSIVQSTESQPLESTIYIASPANIFDNVKPDFSPLRRPHATTSITPKKSYDDPEENLVNQLDECQISNKIDTPSKKSIPSDINSVKECFFGDIKNSKSSVNKENVNLPISNNDLPIVKDSLWKHHFSLEQYKKPEKQVNVTVLYVDSETDNRVWVILQENEKIFLDIFKRLNISYLDKKLVSNLKYDIKNSSRPIRIGDLFVTKMPEDSKFYRVMVIGAPKLIRMTVKVRLIDFGEETSVNIQNLYDCLDEFKYLNAFSFCIKFNKPMQKVNVDDEFSIKFVTNRNQLDSVPEDSSVIPELVELCINEMTSNDRIPDANHIVTINDLKYIGLELGTDMKLMVLDYSILTGGFITVAEYSPENIKFYNNICTSVRQYAKTQNTGGYQPRANELCLAIFDEDNNWYRASCLYGDSQKKEFMLNFIDFGNIQNVNTSKIIPINKEFAELECRANQVFLQDFPTNISNEKLKQLKAKLQNQSILAKSISKSDSGQYMIIIDGIVF